MTDVKWIKLDTSFAENRKMRTIRALHDGSDFVLIWIFLLCLAGKQNEGGKVSLTEYLPYSPKELGKIFGFSAKKIEKSLEIFEDFEMIFVKNGFIFIKNWEKYQSTDRLEKIRNDTKNRVAKHRERIAEATGAGQECNALVTQCNAAEEE